MASVMQIRMEARHVNAARTPFVHKEVVIAHDDILPVLDAFARLAEFRLVLVDDPRHPCIVVVSNPSQWGSRQLTASVCF